MAPANTTHLSTSKSLGHDRSLTIEQTFGCLQRYRRLLVDHEGSTAMSRIMTLLAALFMTGARFERQIRG